VFIILYPMRIRVSYILLFSTIVLFSCKGGDNKSHGAIVLGDTSNIVTEIDSARLKDLVTDFKPSIPSEDNPDSVKSAQQSAPDTTIKQPVAAAPAPQTPVQQAPAPALPQGKGLTVAFNDVTVFIPNIVTKSYRNQDPKKGNGVSYQLTSGNLNNNQLKVTGSVTKVSMHYQTAVVLKNSLQLDALSYTTEWDELSGANGSYTISGLDAGKLEHSDANNAEIKKAVARALRAHHISRRKQAEWLNSVHHTRSVTHAPLKVVLRSVVWRIEGKDAKGKAYQKQLRLDIP
jgi:hypothetical protein